MGLVSRPAPAAFGRRRAARLAVVALLLSAASRADDNDDGVPRQGPGRAYCEHVTAVAASEAALIRAPWLFSTIGTLRGSDAALDDAIGLDGELRLRLQAGIGFSPTRLHQAALLERRAQAECRRHLAEQELRALAARPDGLGAAALDAKIGVLEEALPEAERRLAASLEALEAARTTLQEHTALAIRVDGLRRELAQAERERAALPKTARSPGDPGGPIERLRRWAARREDAASALRRSNALTITLRGGYDEIFGVEQRLPVFGSFALELNPGWLFQHEHEARAQRAAGELALSDATSGGLTLRELRERLRAELAIVRRRRQEVFALLDDLEARLERLRADASPSARDYSDYVWFDVVRLRAEAAMLEAQTSALERATVSTGGDG